MQLAIKNAENTLKIAFDFTSSSGSAAALIAKSAPLPPSARDTVCNLIEAFSSARLSSDDTLAQYISAVLKALLSERGTVADWKKEVPALFDAVSLMVARYGSGPLLTLAGGPGDAYKRTSVRGGRHVMDLGGATLPLPSAGTIEKFLAKEIIPLGDVAEPVELMRFMSTLMVATRTLWAAAMERIASLKPGTDGTRVFFNYKTGAFALAPRPALAAGGAGAGAGLHFDAAGGDIVDPAELDDIAYRFRRLHAVVTERRGASESSTVVFLVSCGADGTGIAPGLAVDTATSPMAVVGCVGGARSLEALQGWPSETMTEMWQKMPALATHVNAYSLTSAGGSTHTVVGATLHASGVTSVETTAETRGFLSAVSTCSRCIVEGTRCDKHCPACSLNRSVCDACAARGVPAGAFDSTRRPCFSCAAGGHTCVRVEPLVHTTDGASEQARMKKEHAALVERAAKVRLAWRSIGIAIERERDIAALLRQLSAAPPAGELADAARDGEEAAAADSDDDVGNAAVVLDALGVASVDELRELLDPFYLVSAGDDSDHIIKLLKMLNGRVFVTPYGIFSRDELAVLRGSKAYGGGVSHSLDSAALGYVDRQSPAMVAVLFSPPLQTALAAVGVADKFVCTYLNHCRDPRERGQAGLSKTTGACDTWTLARPLFTAYDHTGGGRLIVLCWGDGVGGGPTIDVSLFQVPAWMHRWSTTLLSADQCPEYTVVTAGNAAAKPSRAPFDIASSRPAGLAILYHYVNVSAHKPIRTEIYAAVALRASTSQATLIRIIRLSTSTVLATVPSVDFIIPYNIVGLASLECATTVYADKGAGVSKRSGQLLALADSGDVYTLAFGPASSLTKSTAQKSRNVKRTGVAGLLVPAASYPRAAEPAADGAVAAALAPLVATALSVIRLPLAAGGGSDLCDASVGGAAESAAAAASSAGSNVHAIVIATTTGIYISATRAAGDTGGVAVAGVVYGTPTHLVSAEWLGGSPNSVTFVSAASGAILRAAEEAGAEDWSGQLPVLPALAYTCNGRHDVRIFHLLPYRAGGDSNSPLAWGIPHSSQPLACVGRTSFAQRTVSGVSDEAALASPTGLCTAATTDAALSTTIFVASADGSRVALVNRAFSAAYAAVAKPMEHARRGLGVLIPQRGIGCSLFDAAADAQLVTRMPPRERINFLKSALAGVERLRELLHIREDEDYTGFFSEQFRLSLFNRVVSLEHILQRLGNAGLFSLDEVFSVTAEMTRDIEFAFSAGRAISSQMPTALAMLSALGRANFITTLAAGGGISGRQFASVRILKGKLNVYGSDADGGARYTLATILGRYAGRHLGSRLEVAFPRMRRPAVQGKSYPNFSRDFAFLQAYVDFAARHLRQTNPRHSTALGRAGTPPTQLRALLSDSIDISIVAALAQMELFDKSAAEAAAAAAVAEAEAEAAAAAAAESAPHAAALDDDSDDDDDAEEGADGGGARRAKGRGRERHLRLIASNAAADAGEESGAAGSRGAAAADSDADDATGTQRVRRDQQRNRRAARAQAPMPGADRGTVGLGHGATEQRRAVSRVELFLARFLVDYQDTAATKGESSAAMKRPLKKISDLLSTGIADAEAAAGAADADADEEEPAGATGDSAALERQRAARFRGWKAALEDMAASNKPTPLLRLDCSTRHETGEPKFCKTLDEHASSLAAAAAGGEMEDTDARRRGAAAGAGGGGEEE